MKLGISTACYFTRMFTEDALERIHEIGADTCEIFMTTRSEYRPAFVEMLKVRKGNMKAHSVHALGTQFEPQLYASNVRVVSDAVEVYREVCRAAQILDADYYTFHGPLKMKKKEYRFDFPDLAAATNRAVAIANEYGVQLAYENVHYSYFSDPAYFSALAPLCPDLKAVLDVKQATQAKCPVDEFIDAMGDRLVTVHLCDIDKHGATCLPGRGTLDFPKFFADLKRAHFDGTVMLELYASDYATDSDGKDVYRYLSTLL